MTTAQAPLDVLFIQGAGAGAHDADRALADALGEALGTGFRIHFPRMPGEDDPDKDLWSRTIVAEASRTKAAVLVAHSAGAAMVADLLAQGAQGAGLPRLRGIFLLAPPFIGPGGWEFEGYHLDRAGDGEPLQGVPIRFFFGSADKTVPPAHAKLYAAVFPDAAIHLLEGGDHQFSGHVARVAEEIRKVGVWPPA